MTLRAKIQDPLPPAYHRFVRRFKLWRLRNDLNRLAGAFKTDKWGSHWYTQHYQKYFQSIKNKKLNILEIGIGAYDGVVEHAQSLRMWKAYFRRSQIVGVDIFDMTHLREDRIDIRQCDQTDSDALARLSNEYGGFDIVIDDGSHVNEDVIKTFHTLFPLMRPDGIYAVEDVQTAYWPTYGGGMHTPNTSMDFFKCLTDGLNHAEYPIEGYQPSYTDRNIVEIAFFHNLVLIRKGCNTEKTNLPHVLEKEASAAARISDAFLSPLESTAIKDQKR